MARTIGNAGTERFGNFGIVLTTITIVITIVSHPEFLLFKVCCHIAFGEAITSGNHDIFCLFVFNFFEWAGGLVRISSY